MSTSQFFALANTALLGIAAVAAVAVPVIVARHKAKQARQQLQTVTARRNRNQ
jgi:heme exporter protein D